MVPIHFDSHHFQGLDVEVGASLFLYIMFSVLWSFLSEDVTGEPHSLLCKRRNQPPGAGEGDWASVIEVHWVKSEE